MTRLASAGVTRVLAVPANGHACAGRARSSTSRRPRTAPRDQQRRRLSPRPRGREVAGRAARRVFGRSRRWRGWRRLSGIAPRLHRVHPAVVLRRAVAARRARVRRAPQGRAAARVRADARRAGAGARAARCRSRSTPARSARSCARSSCAKEFKLDPIIVGGLEASTVVDDLKAAKARVIYSVNFQAAGGRRRRRGRTRRRRGGDVAIRAMHAMRRTRPKVPAALEKAGVTFAFASDGLPTPADFVRNVGAHGQGRRPPGRRRAPRAHRRTPRRSPGVGDRLGTIEKGKIANLVVTEGDLFDGGRVRYVLVDGRAVNISQ